MELGLGVPGHLLSSGIRKGPSSRGTERMGRRNQSDQQSLEGHWWDPVFEKLSSSVRQRRGRLLGWTWSFGKHLYGLIKPVRNLPSPKLYPRWFLPTHSWRALVCRTEADARKGTCGISKCDGL